MLLEQYTKMSRDRKQLLVDVAANPIFREMIVNEISETKDDLVSTDVVGLSPDGVYNEIVPLQIRLHELESLGELFAQILADFTHKTQESEE